MVARTKSTVLLLLLLLLPIIIEAQDWHRIASCTNPSNFRYGNNADQVIHMARTSSRVRICSRGNSSDCITSRPNSYPIRNLRQGIFLLSHMDGVTPCDAACMRQNWQGDRLRILQMQVSCGNTQTHNERVLGLQPLWGCNTTGGLSFNWGTKCGWDWKDGWYDGGEHTSCTAGCRVNGLTCTPQGFANNNNDVDTSVELINLVSLVGGITSFSECADIYGTSRDVPTWQPGLCYVPVANRPVNTFNCDVVVRSHGKHRMCYCHTVPPQTVGMDVFLDYQSAAPTVSPTMYPTSWYEHGDHAGTNVTQLRHSVENLEQMLGQVQQQMSTMNERLQILDDANAAQDVTINNMRGSIRSALTLVSLLNTSTLPSQSAPAATAQIVASGNDVRVKAPGGVVEVESAVCGVYDPCLSKIVLQNITLALSELRDTI